MNDINIRSILNEFAKSGSGRGKLLAAGLTCWIIALVINVLIPILYKDFFDVLNGATDREFSAKILLDIIFLIAGLNFAHWLLGRIGVIFFSRYSIKSASKLRQNAFDYLMSHSHGFFANNFTGALVQRVNRFGRAFVSITDVAFFNLLPLAVSIGGSIIITLFFAPIASLIIFLWVGSFTVFSLAFARWKLKYDIATAMADSKTTALLADDISNQNSIALFNGYSRESERFKNVTDDQAKKRLLSWDLGNVVFSVQILLTLLAEFAVFYFAIGFWREGLIGAGTFVLIQVYILRIAQQFWDLDFIVRTSYESFADSREMVQIMLIPHEIKNVPQAKDLRQVKGKIEFKGISFSFNKTRNVLSNVNVVIEPGEKVALVGPSGTGKTTFVRLLLRLYEPVEGAILIDGQDIHYATLESLRKNVTLVPQDPVLFHRTLADNIRYGKPGASDEEVREVAKLAHCDEFIENLPLKFDTYVGERGVKLSGGERQRVAIARAILKNAPILILDEATSSLDSQSESLIQDALEKLMEGKTTIAIAHRLSTIRKMDRIIVMKEGEIIEQGSHQALLRKRGGLYRQLWNLQVSGFIK